MKEFLILLFKMFGTKEFFIPVASAIGIFALIVVARATKLGKNEYFQLLAGLFVIICGITYCFLVQLYLTELSLTTGIIWVLGGIIFSWVEIYRLR